MGPDGMRAGIEIFEVERLQDVDGLDGLVTACAAADGHSPFGEHSLLAAVRPGSTGHTGFVAMRSRKLLGYGHLSELANGEGWSIELAVHPAARGAGIGTDLFTRVRNHAVGHGGGSINLWIFGDSARARSLARRFGFAPARELLQLRLAVLPEVSPPIPEGIAISVFADADADEWLAVNNRAFSWHPENGRWTRADLDARRAAPWFDPAGFLIARDAASGVMAGFCWTKLHAGRDGQAAVGEIYIIATDPDRQGKGLGRYLTVAGLASLRRQGAPSGMLYVEAENTAARRLYKDLGFVPDHTDTCWRSVAHIGWPR